MVGIQKAGELLRAASTPALFGLALLAALVWYVSHVVGGNEPVSARRWLLGLAVRSALGFGTLMLASVALGRVLVLATNWPVWRIALAGAVTVELALRFYRVERSVVRPGVRRVIGVLRVTLVLLVAAMLAQPVFLRETSEEFRRTVAVLVDGSASMQTRDTQLTVPEKLRLAEAFADGPIKRPYRLDDAAAELDDLRRQLAVQSEWLNMLGELEPDVLAQHLASRRPALHEALAEARQRAERLRDRLSQALQHTALLDEESHAALSELLDRFSSDAVQPLQQAAATTEESRAAELPAQHGALLKLLSAAADALARLTPGFQETGRELDETFYTSLTDEDRAAVDAFAGLPRADLARAILLHSPADEDQATGSLLDRLQGQYNVKIYAFASEPVEVEATALPTAAQGALWQGIGETNLAAAMEEVSRQVPAEQLAGLLLLSDGRHNTPDRVEPLARQFALADVPLCPIVIGGQKPPKDAAVVSVVAPEVIYAKDTMYVAVELKLDGLKGESVRVALFRDDREEPVDSRLTPVPADEYRKHIELSDTPEAAGLHSYRVAVAPFEGEAFTQNNEYPLTVNVTEELTQLLIIEGRPRWEFRYLKNLFESRDVSVKLQYVLLEPDRIGGVPAAPSVAASAARPREEAQATLLPQDELEWMKFDVIILGDVPPQALNADHYESLRRFVTDRGGNLIVIAGPGYMPHAFDATPLPHLLPVEFDPRDGPVEAPPEESFHIALTPEGRQDVIMRQAVDPEENLEVWGSVPQIYWRHPILDTKPGATVLAYALPDSDPEMQLALDQEQQEEFYRTHALIARHQVAFGQVLMLTFDRTWRLRFKTGDTRHHKFWGQVLRWATAGKLPSGTSLIKIGTDKSRYAPHAPVSVRAKLLQPDLSPLANVEAAVNVYRGEQRILRRIMAYVPGSPGLYAVDLGALPAGAYRAELDCPQALPILATENVQTVTAEFAVEAASSAEQVELSADRGLLSRLAELTGGTVAGPADADGLLTALRPNVYAHSKRFEYVLWNSWPFLAIIMLVGATEWVVRRRNGLP